MSTCSYCYNYGHNRRGCSQRKANLKKSADEGCEWSQDQLTKKVTRRCGFCRSIGHDRRKCSQLQESFDSLEEQIYMGLTHVRRAFIKFGLAPGALLQTSVYGYNEKSGAYGYHDIIGVLTSVRWNYVTPEDLRNSTYRTSCLNVTTTSGERVDLQPPHFVFGVLSDRKEDVIILMEGDTKALITPERQHSKDMTQRYFNDKDFVLYSATNWIDRFKIFNSEYSNRIEAAPE